MNPRRYALGMADETTHRDTSRATLAEFLSTFIFVFAAEGSLLSLDKMHNKDRGGEGWGASGLVVVALAQALSFFAAVASSMNVSGGHVNPAVTFGALVGGRISVLHAFYYWAAQLVAAFFATVILRAATSMRPIATAIELNTVYATAIDHKRGSLGTIAPLAIAFIVGANTLVGGPFEGASMNPARAFGPALAGWRWNNHWVYWLGPFVGAGLAGLIYEFGLIQPEAPIHTHHQPLAPEDY